MQYNTAIYCHMSVTHNRCRRYWISSGGYKADTTIKICPSEQNDDATQRMTKEPYLYEGGFI